MADRLQQRLVEIRAPADVRALAAALAEQAVRDPLTGLYNRRFFDEALAQNTEIARRYNRNLSLVLFDLDHFKAVNDTCGHLAGDQILKTFAQLLRTSARKADVVCRIGGDEFAILFPETELCKARKFTERFMQRLESSVSRESFWKVSASAGLAALAEGSLFALADADLLSAKRNNRGRVG